MKKVFTSLLSLLVGYIYAQHPTVNFYKLTNEEGLSQASVNALFKDSEGFLWIGTDDGLNRYDGKQVKKYYYQYNDTTSIAANEIYGICEDKSGRVWFAHYNAGISCLDKRTGRFFRIQNTGAKNKTLSTNRINGLYCDKNGFIWARSVAGISKVDPKSLTVQNFDDPSLFEISNVVTNADLIEWQEYIWFSGKDKGLLRIRKDGQIDPFIQWDVRLYGSRVFGMYKDNDQDVFVVSERGLFKIHVENSNYTIEDIVVDSIRFATGSKIIPFPNSTRVWVGTTAQGILSVDVKLKKIMRRLTSETITDNLLSNAIWCFLGDDEKNVFVGTGRGVNVYSPYSRLFKNYQNVFRKVHNFGHPIYAIQELSDGNLIIGTKHRAAYHFNTTTYRLKPIPLPNHNPAEPKNTIYHFTPFGVNRFLVCTNDGLYNLTVKKDTGIITRLNKFPELKAFESLPITDVFMYDDSTAYIASSADGFYKWNYKRHTIRQYKKDETTSFKGPVDNQLMKIVPTAEKDLVLCTKYGFSIYYPSADTFLNVLPGNNYPYELPARNVKYAYDDGKYIWVTTYGAGVQKYDKVKRTFTGITTKNGLPNDAVYAVIPDDNGKMWISTNNGLAAYNLHTKTIQTFTTEDGLPDNEFNGYAGYRSNSGKIFYSTLNGIVSVNRTVDVSNPYSPNIVITHFEANYKKKDSIFNCYRTSAIELPQGFNSIYIRFAALSFAAPAKNQYQVKLSGYDNDWIHLNNHNEVRYTHLPPGRYVFSIMASNNSGKWSNKTLSLKITVLPFWYQTGWFKLLVILGACCIAFALYRYRVNQLLKVEKMRQRISRDLHDDIGSTLSSINIYSNLAKEEKDNTFYIDTIQQYTQNIINNLDDLVWSINPKNDGIATMVDRMRSFAEPVLAAKGIRCRFTDDVDYNLNISLEKRNSLFLAYKEMVNNVLKHSNCSSCNINFCTKGKTVSIAVEDDGEGFSMQNLNGKRNGLKNLDYRAKQLNGKFIINSEDGKGTRAELHARI